MTVAAMPSKHREPRLRLTLRAILLGTVAVVTALVILVPILIVPVLALTKTNTMVFPPPGLSLQWFQFVLFDPKWQARLLASVQVGVLTALLATTLATTLALGMQRARIRGKPLLYLLILAPVIVPTVILGTGLYFTFVKGWVLGPIVIGGHMTGSAFSLILAHTALALPLPFITITASLSTVDRNLELAASSLGSGPLRTFRKVTFPLILPGVIAGLVLAFLTSWDEAVVSTLLSSARFSTVPVELFSQIRLSVEPTAAAVSTVIMGATMILLIVMLIAIRRGARA